MNRVRTSLLLTSLFLTLAPSTLASTTWYVDGVNGSDGNDCMSAQAACKTIRHAISLAASGDSVMVAAATYGENLTIGFSLNVIGSGASTTIINGGRLGTVLRVSSPTANVTLHGVTITNGLAQYGGGVLNFGTLNIVASTISGNRASPHCIGLACALAGGAWGGGINNGGTLIINDSTVSGNIAYSMGTPGAGGGGIANGGTLRIDNSTISGNSAQAANSKAIGRGGGISNGGTMTVNNSTLTGNTVMGIGFTSLGGGIENVGNAGAVNLTINNTTISGNSAGSGGGIYNVSTASAFYSGIAALQNSIVADNPMGGNCGGTITTKGYNLSGDSTCSFNGPGDLNNTDPKLGTLGTYGGPTQTIPLLSGSPAIDAGNPSGCTDGLGNLLKADQRGMPRPDPEDRGGCDMGAYENQSD